MRKLFLFVLIIISVYLCLGGIANILINEKFEEARMLPEKVVKTGDKEYRNILEKEASDEYEKLMIVYPIYLFAGDTITFLVMLVSFGTLGACIRVLLAHTIRKIPLEQINIYAITGLGGILGAMIIILAELLPEFKEKSGNSKFFFSIALLSGIYTEQFFAWLEKRFNSSLDDKAKAKMESETAEQNTEVDQH